MAPQAGGRTTRSATQGDASKRPAGSEVVSAKPKKRVKQDQSKASEYQDPFPTSTEPQAFDPGFSVAESVARTDAQL